MPADVRVGSKQPRDRWEPNKLNDWVRRMVSPGTQVKAEVTVVHVQRAQRDPTTRKPYVYLSFQSAEAAEAGDVRYTVTYNARIDDPKAIDQALQLVRGQPGRLTCTVKMCHVGSWGSDQQNNIDSISIAAHVDRVRFVPEAGPDAG
jgi:hypothetical protein